MSVSFQFIIMIINRLVPHQSGMSRRSKECLATCLHLSLLLGTLSGTDICQFSVVGVHVSFLKIEQVVCFIVFVFFCFKSHRTLPDRAYCLSGYQINVESISSFHCLSLFSLACSSYLFSFLLVRVLRADNYAFFFGAVDLSIVSFMPHSFLSGLYEVSAVDLSCIDQFPDHNYLLVKISCVIWFQSCNSICVSCLCYFPIVMNFLRIDLFDKLEHCFFVFFFAVFEPVVYIPFILIADCFSSDYLFALFKKVSLNLDVPSSLPAVFSCQLCFILMSLASMIKLILNAKEPGSILYLKTKCLRFRFLILTSIVSETDRKRFSKLFSMLQNV